ncbi:MAG: tetratricopeptide repeat protein [Pirellulales bacterium]
MSSVPEALSLAIDHHRAGRLAQAAELYRGILNTEPRHAEARHLLGVIAHQQGRSDEAIRLITQAIQIEPGRAAYHSNLGEACRAAGQLAAAQRSLLEAIRLEPRVAASHYNLALVLAAQGDPAAAAVRCRQALALQPAYAEAHRLLGNIHRAQGQNDAARECYARAVAVRPDYYEAIVSLAESLTDEQRFDEAAAQLEHALVQRPQAADPRIRLGDLKSRQGDWPAAIACYQQALALEPGNATAECHWGMALQAQEQFAAAVDRYRRALEQSPDHIETHLNLATTLTLLGQETEAIDHYRHVLGLEPVNERALSNLASICQQHGRFDEALAYHDAALAISPEDPPTHFNRALLLLARGDFAAGWQEYAWRTKVFKSPATAIQGQTWDGSPIGEATLLVHGEQGLGDAIQFLRFVPLVRQRVAHAPLVVLDALVPLLRASGYADVSGFRDPLPAFDYKIPLMDLPRLLGTTDETIPVDIPYLTARDELVEQWRARLAAVPGFCVGICWQGNPGFSADRFRSIPLAAFEALARVPGVSLISLQKGAGTDQIDDAAARFELVDLRPEYDVEDGAFLNAAAIIRNLDLVVSADTAIAHLAGALGVPVWLALAARSDWRWLHERSDSPWYPSARVFRQTRLMDWTELFERMARELAALLDDSARREPRPPKN